MGRGRTSRIFWRKRSAALPRAYADFRDFADAGGRHFEALIAPGARTATTDPIIAEKLATDRLRELQERRRNKVLLGVERQAGLADYAAHHLIEKARCGRVTSNHIAAEEQYLSRAVAFFGADRELSSIRTADVQSFFAHLSSSSNGRGSTLSGGTIRKHLNALSNLYRRAVSESAVPPGFNPVGALIDKPTAEIMEAAWLEVHEAARLLEAARCFKPEKPYCALRAIHPIIGTFLLTGGRKAEVLGLEVGDVRFDRKTVTFRRNQYRRLKTRTSQRVVPLWPQLEEILRLYLFDMQSPRGDGLLFPSDRTGGMIRDLRKALDNVGRSAGWQNGEIRTKMFRHTYCAARLQTLDRGEPISPWGVAREMGHAGVELIDQRYGHRGEVRHRSEVVEYRVEQHREVASHSITSGL